MRTKTVRRISLQVFLHCTLGGFAEAEDDIDVMVARMYRGDRPVLEIRRVAGIGMGRLYAKLRALNIPLRLNLAEKRAA